jgi:hypothetical protein
VLCLRGQGQLPWLAREPGGYRLALAPGDLDLAMFDDLAEQGSQALRGGRRAGGPVAV